MNTVRELPVGIQDFEKFRTPDVVFMNDLKTKRKRKRYRKRKKSYICIMSHPKLNYDAITITIFSGAY